MKCLPLVLLLCVWTTQVFAWSLPTFPKPRPDIAPRIPSPYTSCPKDLKSQGEDQLYHCADQEFWQGFSDGRLKQREQVEALLGKIIEQTRNSSQREKLGRIYALRGYLRLALALENGKVGHLLFGTMESDFKQAKAWEGDNKIYDSFLDTIVMAKAAVFGDWKKAVTVAEASFGILDDQPVNILALSGTTIGFPLTTGVPQKTIALLDNFSCPEHFGFCSENTLHAPFARPGLNFHFGEAYARMGMEAKAEEYFQKARDSAGFEGWAYKDLVQKPLDALEPYMATWKAYSSDESLINKVYANQNYGCLICHGR